MKLSEGVEWGLHCLTMLATLPPDVTLPTKALATFHGLSETYLSKHLQALTNARVIESVPGPRGGYRLMRKPEEITLLEVVEAIEGREPLFRCTEIRRQGPVASCDPDDYCIPCGIHVAMLRADKAWRDVLSVQTLADILDGYTKHVNQRQQQRHREWLTERMRHSTKKTS